MGNERPRLALVAKQPYQPIRSTLPPAMRSSTSGRFAAVVPTIPQLGDVEFEQNEDGFFSPEQDPYFSTEENPAANVEPIKITAEMLRTWLEQFEEYDQLEPTEQEKFVRNLFIFTERENSEVSDIALYAQYQHLLAINKREWLNVNRKYLEQAAVKSEYLDFYLQHFSEWETLSPELKGNLRPMVLNFISGTDPMPSDTEIATYITIIGQLSRKKNIVKDALKKINEESLPQAARLPIQLFMEKVIEENPTMDDAAIVHQLSHLVFNIMQERERYHKNGSTSSAVSQELRLVARVLETHMSVMNQMTPVEDMRQTQPEIPSAIAIEKEAIRNRQTIPAAPMAIQDQAPNPEKE